MTKLKEKMELTKAEMKEISKQVTQYLAEVADAKEEAKRVKNEKKEFMLAKNVFETDKKTFIGVVDHLKIVCDETAEMNYYGFSEAYIKEMDIDYYNKLLEIKNKIEELFEVD